MARKRKLLLAMASWEIGRMGSGFGTKTGGLGAVLEELPEELVAAAGRRGIELHVELLSPCFAHYDRAGLENLGEGVPVRLDSHTFCFEVYRKKLSDRISAIYFWDDWQLNWTNASAIYPDDPEMAYRLFAAMAQAMAGYVAERRFDTVHLHDYHVGLIPFYMGEDLLRRTPVHLTIHNASYQGTLEVRGRGYQALARIGLPGEELFHGYFDFFDNLNFLKAAMLKVHENGGKITTVSGDLKAGWGYAAELRQSAAGVHDRARALKGWKEVTEVFVPNRYLDLLEKLPILGITNGMGDRNRPENLPELKADYLTGLQKAQGRERNLFRNPEVQQEMLSRDHNFSRDSVEMRAVLKRLLHLETFGSEPSPETLLLTAVGRLVDQKNLGLVADLVDRVLDFDRGTKFLILASAPNGDREGKATERQFAALAFRYPQRVYFDRSFNQPLSRLILAAGDFNLIPSKFEPCGLVDYEASLLGNIVIGHRIGGLAKVAHCAYLYEWLDAGDRQGELDALFAKIREAITTFRQDPRRHAELIRRAMSIDASWTRSAKTYLDLYDYGLLYKKWLKKKETILQGVNRTARQLLKEQPSFADFFSPVSNDVLETRLEQALHSERIDQ